MSVVGIRIITRVKEKPRPQIDRKSRNGSQVSRSQKGQVDWRRRKRVRYSRSRDDGYEASRTIKRSPRRLLRRSHEWRLQPLTSNHDEVGQDQVKPRRVVGHNSKAPLLKESRGVSTLSGRRLWGDFSFFPDKTKKLLENTRHGNFYFVRLGLLGKLLANNER